VKITEKEKSKLNRILSKSVNGIDNVCAFEGLIAAAICSIDIKHLSSIVADIFGDQVWDSEDDFQFFVATHAKINNKTARKLQSNIYRPMFAKTKQESQQYALGFINTYNEALADDIKIAGFTIDVVARPDEYTAHPSEQVLVYINEVKAKPLSCLSNAVQNLNDYRLSLLTESSNYGNPPNMNNSTFH